MLDQVVEADAFLHLIESHRAGRTVEARHVVSGETVLLDGDAFEPLSQSQARVRLIAWPCDGEERDPKVPPTPFGPSPARRVPLHPHVIPEEVGGVTEV